MKTFKNKNFEVRDYECTNVVACRADSAPGDNWIPCDESVLEKLTQLWIETINGVRTTFYGYL